MAALADWRIEKEYPPVEGTLLSRWHWEFLRRNKTYQEDYDHYEGLKGDQDKEEQRDLLARKYGLEGIMLDYRDSLESLFHSPRSNRKIRVVQWQTAWVGEDEKGVLIEGKNEHIDYLDPRIRQHECCVVFNLRQDLEQQLEEAAGRINRQKQRYIERRGSVENYPYYLRLIDAGEDGIDHEELIDFFLNDIDKPFAMKKIKTDIQEATRLRDIGYQYI